MMLAPNEIIFILLVLMSLLALWAVMATDLLKSTIALALTSVCLSLVIYLLGSPLAAVFELSVCAGLITVIFVSAISMVKLDGNTRQEDNAIKRQKRLKKYIALPILLVIAAVLLWMNRFELPVQLPPEAFPLSMSEIMWGARQPDLVGQIIIILVGVFGVVVLFKEFAKRKVSRRK